MTERSNRPRLTTTAGAPVGDNQNSMTVGERGPLLLQDYQLMEKLTHQNRERIPERVVHAKGWGAHGTLKITGDISKDTKAKVVQPGTETPMLARVSTESAKTRDKNCVLVRRRGRLYVLNKKNPRLKARQG